ncbi:MAG: hypothetical protein ABIV05_07160, partial [Actinomycetota bacterium]
SSVAAQQTAPAASTTSSSEPEATTTDTTTTDTTEAEPTETPTSADPTSPAVTTAAPTATATGGSVPTSGPTRWPKALGEPGQGDPVWAVYLALAHAGDDPAIDAAVRKASGAGYTAVQGDLACDQGAIEALGLDQYDYWSAATVYFANRTDATDFVASYQAKVGKVAGSAQVNVGCLD